MSLENHPNFHAVKFVTAILSAYYESLRGEAGPKDCPHISQLAVNFCYEVEKRVDKHVRRKHDEEK